MVKNDATEEGRQLWDALSGGWERHRTAIFESQRAVSEALIDAMAPRDGDTILELTAGPGETGLLLAERSAGARVIVSDIAEGMVGAAAREAERRKLSNVETRVIDAQRIDLPDASVHGVMSRYGLMLVPDPAAAFREIRRVLEPGRPLAYAVWGDFTENAWMLAFGAALVMRGHFQPPEGGPFSLTTEDENRDVLRAAGFTMLDVEVRTDPMVYRDLDHYWDVSSSVGGPVALIAQSLSAEQVAEIKDDLVGLTAPFMTDDGLRFPAKTLLVRAS